MNVLFHWALILISVFSDTVFANEEKEFLDFLYQDNETPNKETRVQKPQHYYCRNNEYRGFSKNVLRVLVPDDRASWKTEWPEYKPVTFTDDLIKSEPWADPEISNNKTFTIKYNCVHNKINRVSYLGNYTVVDSYPLNPMGRTGIRGRGVLGRWGPNHSVLVVVTRWSPGHFDSAGDDQNEPMWYHGKLTAQFVGVQYRVRDKFYWGIPGGFIDRGEKVLKAVKREFLEEATSYLVANKSEKERLKSAANVNFVSSDNVYKGYNDCGRNTDNAWIEVVAKHFHDCCDTFELIPLAGGDGFLNATWVDIERNIVASNMTKKVLENVAKKLFARW